MTETTMSPAESPYATLLRLQTEYDQLQAVIDMITNDLIAPRQERAMAIMEEAALIAKVIYTGKLEDPDGLYALSSTYKTRRTTKIDVEQLRIKHPEIYARAKPYVSDNVAMDILVAQRGSMDDVQDLLKGINPDVFEERAKIKKDDLERAINPPEREQLVSEGIIEDGFVTVGEPRLCSIGLAKVFEDRKTKGRRKKPAEIEEGDDDE